MQQSLNELEIFMIKFVYCIRKRADLSNEEFHNFWCDVHGPFIRNLAQTLKATRYIQSHTIDTPVNIEIGRRNQFRRLFSVSCFSHGGTYRFRLLFTDHLKKPFQTLLFIRKSCRF